MSKTDWKIGFFGVWDEETKDTYSRAHYLRVLDDAVRRCREGEETGREVLEALDWLEEHSVRKGLVQGFRKALDIPEQARRFEALIYYKSRIT